MYRYGMHSFSFTQNKNAQVLQQRYSAGSLIQNWVTIAFLRCCCTLLVWVWLTKPQTNKQPVCVYPFNFYRKQFSQQRLSNITCIYYSLSSPPIIWIGFNVRH